MIISKKQENAFNKATKSLICQEKLVKDKNDKDYEKLRPVRDHCHYTGKYRGPAHNSCNLKYIKPKFNPVLFHNLSGYDSHFFIKNLGRTQSNINCIPNNEEKYISFSKEIVVDKFFNKKGIAKLNEIKDTSGLKKLTDEGILEWFNKSIYNDWGKDKIYSSLDDIFNDIEVRYKGDLGALENELVVSSKIISLAKHEIKFMTSSLDKLVGNLPKDDVVTHFPFSRG